MINQPDQGLCFEDEKIPHLDATSEWDQNLGYSSLAVLAGIGQPSLSPMKYPRMWILESFFHFWQQYK